MRLDFSFGKSILGLKGTSGELSSREKTLASCYLSLVLGAPEPRVPAVEQTYVKMNFQALWQAWAALHGKCSFLHVFTAEMGT